MDRERRRGRLFARALALGALAAALIVVVVVVSGSIDGDDGGEGDEERGRGVDTTSGCRPEDRGAVKDGYYVVQEGDILSVIAERTCVPEPELTRLNPRLDPQALEPQRCVNLVERACKRRE